MRDMMLVILALAVLCGFFGILLWFVPRWDLGSVIAITLLLAGYDLLLHGRRRGGS